MAAARLGADQSGLARRYLPDTLRSMNNTALQKSKRIIIPTVLSVCLAAFVEHAAALPGDLDLTFGGTGTVTAAIGSGDDTGNCMVIQNDGRIVVAGYSRNGSNEDFALVRYNADGTLDTGFNGNGKVITDFGGAYDYGYSVALQAGLTHISVRQG